MEGVAAFVNLTTGKVLEFIDIDRNAPVTRDNAEFDAASRAAARRRRRRSRSRTPHGPDGASRTARCGGRSGASATALHPREGLVLYTVGYEDGGRVRPVMYRGSLSEMAVPYGDPRRGVVFPQYASTRANWGSGSWRARCGPGVDCPQNCTVFDATVAGEAGEPRQIPGAVGAVRARGRDRVEARRRIRGARATWCSSIRARRAITSTASSGSSIRTARSRCGCC